MGESTVRLFKKMYLEEVKQRVMTGVEFEEVRSLPKRKRGKKVLLGELDMKVQSYIQALSSAGTPIGSSVVMAAATGIVMAYDRTLLHEHGGYITISKTWALSLRKRVGYVKRKATTKSTPAMSGEVFEQAKTRCLRQITRMVKFREMSDNLIINLNQTGIHLVPFGVWTMATKGSRRVEMAGLGDKRQVTATFAACLDGTFLPMQILYQRKTVHSHPKVYFPRGI